MKCSGHKSSVRPHYPCVQIKNYLETCDEQEEQVRISSELVVHEPRYERDDGVFGGTGIRRCLLAYKFLPMGLNYTTKLQVTSPDSVVAEATITCGVVDIDCTLRGKGRRPPPLPDVLYMCKRVRNSPRAGEWVSAVFRGNQACWGERDMVRKERRERYTVKHRDRRGDLRRSGQHRSRD